MISPGGYHIFFNCAWHCRHNGSSPPEELHLLVDIQLRAAVDAGEALRLATGRLPGGGFCIEMYKML